MGKVPRYTNISYEYYDLDGILNRRVASGFHSRVIQHECDHLDGYVYTQRMKDLSSLTFEDVRLKNTQNSQELIA
jgi:peptide deformylase